MIVIHDHHHALSYVSYDALKLMSNEIERLDGLMPVMPYQYHDYQAYALSDSDLNPPKRFWNGPVQRLQQEPL